MQQTLSLTFMGQTDSPWQRFKENFNTLFPQSKLEGLALTDDGSLAISNDNGVEIIASPIEPKAVEIKFDNVNGYNSFLQSFDQLSEDLKSNKGFEAAFSQFSRETFQHEFASRCGYFYNVLHHKELSILKVANPDAYEDAQYIVSSTTNPYFGTRNYQVTAYNSVGGIVESLNHTTSQLRNHAQRTYPVANAAPANKGNMA